MTREHPWWDNPVWQIDTGFSDQFNEGIIAEAYDIAKSIQSGEDAEPKDSLWDYDRPNLNLLKNTVLDIVRKNIMRDISEAKQLNLDCEYTGGWINVIEPKTGIEVHAHNDCSLVMTYYLKTPAGSGDFVYLNTKPIITDSGKFIQSTNPAVTFERITPYAGLLLLFPSYMLHEVEENLSDGLRISLSADIKQIVDKSAPNAMILKSWCSSLLKLKEWTPLYENSNQ